MVFFGIDEVLVANSYFSTERKDILIDMFVFTI